MAKTEKQTVIEQFMASCLKTFGEGSVISANSMRVSCEAISTGSLKVDIASGIGGFPRGRMVEIFGAEGSGKSTLALQTVGNGQKAGLSALYIDNEHALDPGYASNLGVNLETLVISQPSSAEDCLGIMKTALEMAAFDIIVLDSIAGLTAQAVIDGDVGDAHVGRIPRLLSQNMQHFCSEASKGQILVILINQIREKIGVTYGSPETTGGGRALRHYTSMRVQTTRLSESQKEGDDIIGNTVKVKFVKNRLAPPFKECSPQIVYGEGFNREYEIIDIGSDTGVIEKSGSWYNYNGERMGQGKDNARQFLLASPEITADIELKIKQQLGLIPVNQ